MTVYNVLVFHKEFGVIKDDTKSFTTLSNAKEYFKSYIENFVSYFRDGIGTEEEKNYCLQVGNFNRGTTYVALISTDVEEEEE